MSDVATVTEHAYGKRWPRPGQRFPEADLSGLTILGEIDPRSWMPPALNQGRIGSCTANATARCFRADTIKDEKDCGELSRRWIYHFEKAIEHTLGQGDTGAIGHDAFTVAKHGIPNESLYPYSEDIDQVEAKPPDVEPRAYTLKKPVRSVPQSLAAVQQALSNNQTIPFGFVVYASFEDRSWWPSGEMPLPDPREPVLGEHEALACGYLKEYPHHTLILNSWDVTFGVNGYFLMPNAYLLDQSRVSDLRTIQRTTS